MKKLNLSKENIGVIIITHRFINNLMWEYIDTIDELTKDELKELRFLANMNFQLEAEKERREENEKNLPFC